MAEALADPGAAPENGVNEPLRLDWIFLARYAEVPDDGTLNALGAGLDSLMGGPLS